MNDKVILVKLESGDVEGARTMVGRYVASLLINLSFQDIERELEDFPLKYREPEGAFFLAKLNGTICGCVGLRKIDQTICEMKRLFVPDEFKGLGIGRSLVEKIVDEGKIKGYIYMRLDTLRDMKAALGLYRSVGFHEIGPYTYNPILGAVFMELDLQDGKVHGVSR